LSLSPVWRMMVKDLKKMGVPENTHYLLILYAELYSFRLSSSGTAGVSFLFT
jgi:hypothetical protein